jgi:hypothetical protein
MKAVGFTSIILAAALTAPGQQASPQTEDPLLGITRAGIVNRTEGEVNYKQANGDWVAADAGRRLRNGEVVKTGPKSRAEILLAPGSYLRLSENTTLVLSSTSVYNPKLKLLDGSIIIEIAKPDLMYIYHDLYDLITINTPRSEFAVVQGGIYRFNVEADGRAEVVVREGKAVVEGVTVKKGQKAVVENGSPVLTAFDKKIEDAFDQWSKQRAASLIRANKALAGEPWYKDYRREKKPAFKEEKEELPPHLKHQYLAFAKAGVLNIVEDGVVYKRGDADWAKLAAGGDLSEGDLVKTGDESRAEILLNLDCYLRLSNETEIILADETTENVRVNLLKGTAIVEALWFNRKRGATVTLATRQAEWVITEPGLYRFEVAADGRSELMVRHGAIQFEGRKIKGGKKLVFDDASWTVVEFDRKSLDGFDLWSKERGEGLPVSQFPRSARIFRNFNLNRARYTGMWLFSPKFECHTYVPGLWSVSSPYGGSYPVWLNHWLLNWL